MTIAGDTAPGHDPDGDRDALAARWGYRLQRGRAWFDEEVRRAHRALRLGVVAYIRTGRFLALISCPIIYSLIVPLALLDAWVSAYQWICFPIYGIAPVRRRDYFALDRRHLAYLNAIEKVGCTFCSYANGLIAYVREIAARTEQHWCPIRHAHPVTAPHGHYRRFFDYGDAQGYHAGLAAARDELRAAAAGAAHDAP